MRVSVFGSGYVGLVAGASYASSGNHVVIYDIDTKRIERLNQGEVPIFEPHLEELIHDNRTKKRLEFTDSAETAVHSSEIIGIAVGTESQTDGSANLSAVWETARTIATQCNGPKIIVIKSTVPVGTADRCRELLKESRFTHSIVSNPEFLKEGSAVADFMKPERVIIGTQPTDALARETMGMLYKPFMRKSDRILYMSNRSAELTKYAANSFLALRVSYINEIALLCEKVEANIHEVRRGLITDSRIGEEFLFPGMGYGGSCFPKDIRALVQQGQAIDFRVELAEATARVNDRQRRFMAEKIEKVFSNSISGKHLAIWGGAFKANTDDIRESATLYLIDQLAQKGMSVRVSDPKANANLRKQFGTKIEIFEDPYVAAKGADALCVTTEWPEFRSPDFSLLKSSLRLPIIFDGRNLYERGYLERLGFSYHGIGS